MENNADSPPANLIIIEEHVVHGGLWTRHISLCLQSHTNCLGVSKSHSVQSDGCNKTHISPTTTHTLSCWLKRLTKQYGAHHQSFKT